MFAVTFSPQARYFSSNTKLSGSLQPKFSGHNLKRINLFCEPQHFESKKEEFKKIINNLVSALNGMNKGTFFLREDNTWGDKKGLAYLHIFLKDAKKDIQFLQLASEFYKETILRHAKYQITSRTEKLKDPLLPDAVKKEVEALEKLFDEIPAMRES